MFQGGDTQEADVSTTLHMVAFLRRVLPHLGGSSAAKALGMLLKLPGLGDQEVALIALRSVDAAIADERTSLSAEALSDLLGTLLEIPPTL